MEIIYASVDIETTGLDPENHQVLQFGVVLDDLRSPLEHLPKMELLIVPDGDIKGDPFALHMNADLLRRIARIRSGVYEEPYADMVGLGDVFCEFMQSHGWDFTRKLLIVGQNYGSFDHQFLKRDGVFNHLKLNHRFVSAGNMFWNPYQDGANVPDLRESWRRAFGEEMPVEGQHTALSDALRVVQVVRGAKERPFH